ncbi:SAM-dependent methyltransferase [Lewinellaceae bacterium SD302]|nr:SAM-dependent methyltransferase [Lewinellaceae bacterium SD302]
MYNLLKNTLKRLVPNDFIQKNERMLRNLAYPFFRGAAHRCNICEAQLRGFVGEQRICPRCGSLARGRRLFTLLSDEIERRGPKTKVLHLSPASYFRDKIITTYPELTYHTSDYVGEFDAENSFDLRDTRLNDDSYDLVICYHILEHIVEDRQAMNELYRILRPGGSGFIQTPYCSVDGSSLEDYSITTPEGRLEHFGQDDHVRIYSVRDLTERLSSAGFGVEVLAFPSDPKTEQLGFKEGERVILVEK